MVWDIDSQTDQHIMYSQRPIGRPSKVMLIGWRVEVLGTDPVEETESGHMFAEKLDVHQQDLIINWVPHGGPGNGIRTHVR